MLPGENVVITENQQGSLKSDDLAWLAGLWDGDGWIGITKAKRTNTKQNRYSASVALATTSDRLAERVLYLLDELGCLATMHHKHPAQKKSTWTGKDVWHREKWDIALRSNKATKIFLEAVGPYLVEKSVCSDLVLSYIRWRESFGQRQWGGKRQMAFIANKAETIIRLLREDRQRNDPSEAIRLNSVE